ncbi:MAG TPA: hypothetical protein DCY74_03945 [Clostridiales bacterium]|jgi:hypothetical protein|nr:hypothetical protein [Clostridiales bacterium]HCG36592.1 hypothetical protein [Clostridiales bacterium]
MNFYNLLKEERKQTCFNIRNDIFLYLEHSEIGGIHPFFDDSDTYMRKAAYVAIGKIYRSHQAMRETIIKTLEKLMGDQSERVRQTAIYSCGEIATIEFDVVEPLLETGLHDKHHSIRNAVIGSLKTSGQKNPVPTLTFCKKHILSPDAEIRRQACHGLELRGRTHPQDVIDILKLLQFEKTKRVYDTLIHVLGQISYKKGCFRYVINQLKIWENKDLYPLVQNEIIEIHGRYEKFSEFTQQEIIDVFAKEHAKPV